MISKLIRSSVLPFLFCATAAAIHLPVYFEPNQGQTDAAVQFVARTPRQTVFLSGNEVVLSAKERAPVRMKLAGARHGAKPLGMERAQAASNYFAGNNPSKWRTGIPQFAKVRYTEMYPGIDVVYYGNERDLEYDFVVAPGADPSVIDLAYEGAAPELAENGDLLLKGAGWDLRQHRPKIYQEIGGKRVEVAGSYRLNNSGHVKIALGQYDRTRALVIDPIIQYSTYLGGPGYDAAFAIAVDSGGNSYITGNTNSITFPAQGAAQEIPGGGGDAFVAKFSPLGDQLIYITYLGGKQNEAGNSIAVDAQRNVYVTGFTTSLDFPVQGGVQRSFGGGEEDAFVTKISPGGDRILYSTYLGGGANDFASDIAVDSAGAAYVTGWTRSSDFPTQNAFQSGPSGGGEDAFVTKLSPSGAAYVYSTFVGGNGRDLGLGIAVDAAGAAYVTGSTNSAIFPTVNPLQPKLAGVADAFLFKLAPAGNALVFCTYFGGAGDDTGFRVALDASGIYVVGYTSSSNFPVMNAAQMQAGGGWDAFVSKFTPAGTAVLYSTYVGGAADEFGYGIAVDASGGAYLTGWTSSMNFPVQSAVQAGYGGGASDAFLTRLSPGGNQFVFSTFVGGSGDDEGHGIALDPSGSVLIAGRTSSAALPGARNRYTEGTGKFDAFVTRISTDANPGTVASVNPARLTFSGANPASQTLSVTGGGQAAATTTANASWLSVTQAAGASTFTVSVNRAGLSEGTYTGSITIVVPGAVNSPLAVPVSFTVAPVVTGISISADGVVNAASYQFGAVAPGEIVTIFGSGFGPPSLTGASLDVTGLVSSLAGGTRVLFDGVPAPVVYSVSGQVSVVVPYAVGLQTSTVMQVEYLGARSLTIGLAVARTAPGVFTADASGHGQAVAVNADGSLNSQSRPAERGSVIVLYATGEGQTAPGGVDGKPGDANALARPLLPVIVRINGVVAEVLYAGAAPGLVAGVMQLNVRIPENTPAAAVPVVVSVGGVNSRFDVTVAVR